MECGVLAAECGLAERRDRRRERGGGSASSAPFAFEGARFVRLAQRRLQRAHLPLQLGRVCRPPRLRLGVAAGRRRLDLGAQPRRRRLHLPLRLRELAHLRVERVVARAAAAAAGGRRGAPPPLRAIARARPRRARGARSDRSAGSGAARARRQVRQREERRVVLKRRRREVAERREEQLLRPRRAAARVQVGEEAEGRKRALGLARRRDDAVLVAVREAVEHDAVVVRPQDKALCRRRHERADELLHRKIE